MPGLLMTTSQASRAARPPWSVASTSSPSTDAAWRVVVHQNRHVAHRPQAMQAGRPFDAQPPDADARATERGPGDQGGHSGRGCSGVRGSEQSSPHRERSPPRVDSARRRSASEWSRRVPCRSRRSAARQERGAAFVDVTHALEGLGIGRQSQHGREAFLQFRVVQGLMTAEDGAELAGAHEGGQDEIDEATLVARAAPLGEPLAPGPGGRLDCSCGTPHGTRRAGRTAAPPTARSGSAGRRRPIVRVPGSTPPVGEALLERGALGPLVVDGTAIVHERGHRGRPFVGEHHGVAPIEDGGDQGGRRDHRRDGHVAVEEAEFARAPDGRDRSPGRCARWGVRSLQRRPRWRRTGRRGDGRCTGRHPGRRRAER